MGAWEYFILRGEGGYIGGGDYYSKRRSVQGCNHLNSSPSKHGIRRTLQSEAKTVRANFRPTESLDRPWLLLQGDPPAAAAESRRRSPSRAVAIAAALRLSSINCKWPVAAERHGEPRIPRSQKPGQPSSH